MNLNIRFPRQGFCMLIVSIALKQSTGAESFRKRARVLSLDPFSPRPSTERGWQRFVGGVFLYTTFYLMNSSLVGGHEGR